MLRDMISAARKAVWKFDTPPPVTFKIGRKYATCSDAVYTLPGSYKVSTVTPTMLEISGANVENWVNANLMKVKGEADKKGFNIMPYTGKGGTIKLRGPWNTLDCNYMASRRDLVSGEEVRVRVSPEVDVIAPSEFRVTLRAVDVMRITNG